MSNLAHDFVPVETFTLDETFDAVSPLGFVGPPSPAQRNLDVALALASAGLFVFPANSDKKPLIDRWPLYASSDPAQIRRWWQQSPGALPAIAMGLSGLIV